MALMANLQRDKKKRSKPFVLADFRLKWTRSEPQSAADMEKVAKALTLAYGGTVTTKQGGSDVEPGRSPDRARRGPFRRRRGDG